MSQHTDNQNTSQILNDFGSPENHEFDSFEYDSLF